MVFTHALRCNVLRRCRSDVESAESLERRSSSLPRHIAIIMDGNGRWATRDVRPASRTVLALTRYVMSLGCASKKASTFSRYSTSWKIGSALQKVGLLMNLFLSTLSQEMKKLHENNILRSWRLVGVQGLSKDSLRKLRLWETQYGPTSRHYGQLRRSMGHSHGTKNRR